MSFVLAVAVLVRLAHFGVAVASMNDSSYLPQLIQKHPNALLSAGREAPARKNHAGGGGAH
jgi:hypothetical protein